MSAKINYESYAISSNDGQIVFGEVDKQNITAGILMRCGTAAADGIPHYIRMDKDGDATQKGRRGTIAVCPGSFQVKAGEAVADGVPGVFIDAQNGDLVLKSNGRIRIIAQDIDLIARGGGERGNIQALANEKIILHSNGDLLANGDDSATFRSQNKTEIIGESILNMYGGLVELFDGASTIKGSRSIIPFLPATPRELIQAITKKLS